MAISALGGASSASASSGDRSLDVEKIFIYKYANRKRAEDYQTEEYVTSLTETNAGIPYVITCFIHMDFFMVWHQSIGKGNGKYPVSKHDLVAFEYNSDSDYEERIIGGAENATVYIFRNASGFNKFYNKVVAPSTSS